MRHHCCQRVRRIIGSHCDEADIKFASDLIWKKNGNLDVESAVRYVDLQSLLPYRRNVFAIDIHKSHIVARASKPPADDAANGTGSDDNHTHMNRFSLNESPKH